jgi:hypothetical protein
MDGKDAKMASLSDGAFVPVRFMWPWGLRHMTLSRRTCLNQQVPRIMNGTAISHPCGSWALAPARTRRFQVVPSLGRSRNFKWTSKEINGCQFFQRSKPWRFTRARARDCGVGSPQNFVPELPARTVPRLGRTAGHSALPAQPEASSRLIQDVSCQMSGSCREEFWTKCARGVPSCPVGRL